MSVCVGVSGLTTASDDPSSSACCVVCTERFLGGPRGGHTVQHSTSGSSPRPTGFRAAPRNYFFWWFFLFLADFAIFSGFLN
jgi:hypothetical protein